ncbi:MAG: glycosyltransferase family 39 protein [Bacteroidales bacterium]|nr:glycosyltransferase family 39 protein [Bacteroidales bacterium]MCF8343321.1 glycosyltransferase family 39 protein [Bacteroidales bacterium]MCF8351860.1 glycosyltransferase family 39 protein [Bacteroidales bacterium]MCF8376406.1 glycosyltransferase family 39 protein [Bacteroidales bacterium]
MNKLKTGHILLILIALSTLIRGFLAAYLELGNDEVYYITYAIFPDLSHFDHPPMVGLMIRLFSFNLSLDSEFFIRLSSVIIGAVNTWLIYMIGKGLKDQLTGLYAAILYTASINCFIIAGTFILPDTPQLFFWLISMYFLLHALPDKKCSSFSRKNLLLAGLAIGLGMLSKYTSVFLWFGAILYILIYNRKWLARKELYIAGLMSLLVFLPVIIWNIQYDFISFTFQGERVDIMKSGINLDSFLTELSGQFFYNNPFIFIIVLLSLWGIIKGKKYAHAPLQKLLLWLNLPLIIIFLLFSLFRSTLPHWTGPGYTGLYLLAAAFLSEKYGKSKKPFPWPLQLPVYFLLIIIVLGIGQIKGGWLFYSGETKVTELGRKDLTLDMYGWRQLGGKFENIHQQQVKENLMQQHADIISYRWFPAANLDYYVAHPTGLQVKAIGKLDRIHKYAWINRFRGGFKSESDAYYFTESRDYKDPYALYGDYYEEIIPLDTIAITRGDRTVKYFFLYKLKDMKKLPQTMEGAGIITN